MNADLIVIKARGSPRSLIVHLVVAIAVVIGAIASFDAADPTRRLGVWSVLLVLVIPFAVRTFATIHRSVALDVAKKQVIMTGRPWLVRHVTERYDVAALRGVRSFVDRPQVKAPWTNHLELVAPDSQRGLLLLKLGASADDTENAVIGALRRHLSTDAWFDDLGFVGKTTRMPRQVRAAS